MFDFDYETMSFPNQKVDHTDSWIRVDLRGPKNNTQPYNMSKHSIYLLSWNDSVAGIYLTSGEARKLALLLLSAADMIEERNNVSR